MSRPELRRRREPPAVRARLLVMGGLLLLTAGLLWWQRSLPEVEAAALLEVVEVRGEVTAPGIYELPAPATVHAALEAAGRSDLGDIVDAELQTGTRVVIVGDRVHLEPMDELLVFDLPVDLNEASALALEAIPGIGPSRSAAILLERQQGGPFASVEELVRVKGIGPATVEQLRPFLTVGAVSPGTAPR